MAQTQIIELDCPPQRIRPAHLIAGVIKDTGLNLKDTISRFMGNWTWDYSEVDPEYWKAIQPIIYERIRELHDKGLIRYGSC